MNLYNINKTIDSESTSTKFLDVGIHEDVELTNVEYKVSPNGNEFMVFVFEKDGKKLEHTEWIPRDNDPQKLEKKTLNQVKRISHIVRKFISEDDYNVTANDFKTFAEQTIKLLGDAYKGVKVRIKIIYSFTNFTSLPKYTPFIELMSIPKEQSRLEILSIDKMVKDKADYEPKNVNPFDEAQPQQAEVVDTKAEGLPF